MILYIDSKEGGRKPCTRYGADRADKKFMQSKKEHLKATHFVS